MKALIQLALLAAVIYAGYWYYQNHYLAAEAASTPTASEPGQSGRIKIVCPSCDGEGRLTFVDRQGRNHRYSCKVCGFSGSRTVSLPEGAKLCPDCKGMGRYEIKETRRNAQEGYILSAARCQRCVGTGHLQSRTTSGRQTPTR